MATIRKRNNKYQVQVRIQGLARSATLISLQHARQWARRKELELESLVSLENYIDLGILEKYFFNTNRRLHLLKNHPIMKIL